VHFPCLLSAPLRVFPGGGREGGAPMTGATVRESVQVAGLGGAGTHCPRVPVGAGLGHGHPGRQPGTWAGSLLRSLTARGSAGNLTVMTM
jgi:hypothetical protein